MSVLRRATSAAGTKAWKRRYPGIPPAQAAQQTTTQQHPWGPSRAHGHADLSRGHIPLTVCLGHLISPSVRISSTRFGGRRPVRLQLASRHARSRRSPHPLPAARLTRGQNASGTHQHRAHPLTPPRPTSVRRRLVGWLLCLCLPLVTPERPSSSSVC
jgi:hypothetical protein